MATVFTKFQLPLFKKAQARLLNAVLAEVAVAVDANESAEGASLADFTIGTEATNAINVAVELQDADGVAVESTQVVTVFLSDSDAGADVVATAPDGGWAIGTDGFVLDAQVAGKMSVIETKADGTFDLTITESGADTFYMCVVMPNGTVQVSDAITFA